MKKYKSNGKRGLFDDQENFEKLSAIGNPLERIKNIIDFEMFRDILEEGILTKKKKNNAEAKPYDVVMIILQRYYGLGDTQLEYQIIDRLSFKKFLGQERGDKVPDEKTVWAFRERLTNEGLVEKKLSVALNDLDRKTVKSITLFKWIHSSI